MASWRYAIGNLARRAALDAMPVSPATADPLLPLSNLANDYPDLQAGFMWRSDGVYEADLDLNLLAATSGRSDAPTGWTDLLNLLAGTPGLPANPPDWGTYGSRTALRLFRPVVQEIHVMPGEAIKLQCGIRWPAAASGATGIRVRVLDLSSGKGWNGSAWASGGIVDSQTVADTWKEIDEQIDADTARTQRAVYRVIFEPIATSYGATTYVYASANGGSGRPALFAEANLAAIVGHNIPANATVALGAISLTPAQPSCYTVAGSAVFTRTWRLSITMPSGVQPRPIIGEVWIGKVRTLLAGSPILPIGLEESSPGQLSVESGRGRLEIVGGDALPVARLEMQFRAKSDAAYQQIRDEIARLTRFGADPLLLLPSDAFEGAGRLFHGRIGSEVTYSRITPAASGDTLRSFALPFRESPFASL